VRHTAFQKGRKEIIRDGNEGPERQQHISGVKMNSANEKREQPRAIPSRSARECSNIGPVALGGRNSVRVMQLEDATTGGEQEDEGTSIGHYKGTGSVKSPGGYKGS